MRRLLSVFIAVCLVLSLFTGIFVSMPSARADITEGDYLYNVSGGKTTIIKYMGGGGHVTIPSTLGGYPVTSIGDDAFSMCMALTSVTIPNSVTTIDGYAFSGCYELTSITIGTSVTTLGIAAFAGCYRLPSVTIPTNVTSIGIAAFASCRSLTSVTIPNSVTRIGTSAFEECTGLTSVSIGSGVTSIGYETFWNCSGLTSVTIPNSVTRIGGEAFSGCSGLTAAHFVGNAPTGTTDMFRSCASGFTIHYSSGTTGWTNPWYGYPTAIEKDSTKKQTVLVLHIGKSTFTINGARKTLDSLPIIKNGRTLVPIRAIIEALAGTVGWDATTKKATVTLGKKTIALWIGKSAATVNGVSTPIDSTNAKVAPEIISGRTMLPLRFVTENFGCSVVWVAATKTITITYAP
jgi:hypothetical protein